jgi:hypothetical protein
MLSLVVHFGKSPQPILTVALATAPVVWARALLGALQDFSKKEDPKQA